MLSFEFYTEKKNEKEEQAISIYKEFTFVIESSIITIIYHTKLISDAE